MAIGKQVVWLEQLGRDVIPGVHAPVYLQQGAVVLAQIVGDQHVRSPAACVHALQVVTRDAFDQTSAPIEEIRLHDDEVVLSNQVPAKAPRGGAPHALVARVGLDHEVRHVVQHAVRASLVAIVVAHLGREILDREVGAQKMAAQFVAGRALERRAECRQVDPAAGVAAGLAHRKQGDPADLLGRVEHEQELHGRIGLHAAEAPALAHLAIARLVGEYHGLLLVDVREQRVAAKLLGHDALGRPLRLVLGDRDTRAEDERGEQHDARPPGLIIP